MYYKLFKYMCPFYIYYLIDCVRFTNLLGEMFI